jgi:uncharacterized protein (UPF0276 family)
MLSPDNERPKVGIGFRAEEFDAIATRLDDVDVVEVTAEHYIYGSRRVRAMIEGLRERVPIVAHGVTLSLGTAMEPDRSFLREIAAFLGVTGAPWYSEHLAFTKTPSRDLSQLLPLVRTDEMIKVVVDNLAVVHEELRVPMLLENVAYYFEYPESSMSELEFLLRILSEGDCSLLLDLENLRINGTNHGYDAQAALRELPKGSVRAVHVAGGSVVDGVHVDSHDHPIPDRTLELLKDLLRLQRPESVILERDREVDDVRDVLDDVRRIRDVVEEVWPP